MEDRAEILTALRKSLAEAEHFGGPASAVPLGQPGPDTTLKGGLRPASLHEVYAYDGSHAAAATGFAVSLAQRLSGKKKIFWITTSFAAIEHGAVSATGLLELGLDPSRVILVNLAQGEDALKAAGDVLFCPSVGALVLEIHGKVRALDLTASRRLSLASGERQIPTIMLRLNAKPEASSAETRWLVHASASPPIRGEEDWGLPGFDVWLLRNRHGETGHWRMVWDCEDGLFREHIQEPAPHYGDVVSASADRPATAHEERRLAG